MTSKRHVEIAREALRRILENEGKEDPNGRWVTLDNGVHVFINKAGDISKGPAELTGRNLNDMKADKPAAGSGPGAPPSIRPETPPETAQRNAYAEGPEADADKIAQAREFLRSKGFHVPDAPVNPSKAGAREVKGPRITYMDPEKILAQVRVKQFKAGADEKTGEVEPLEGDYDHRGSGPLQLWEGKDGTVEVISGRHRLALAKRSGVGEVAVQVYREADGFTLEQAKNLDAELNIRDGNGSVADYAQYFRANKMSKEDAKRKGLLGRAKGQDGWEIGQGATEELLAALKGKQINDKQAATISRILPGDQAGQSLGLKLAGEGKNAEAIGDMLQAYKLHSARRKADASQLDMFGNNDAAIKEMMENAAKAGTIRRGLSARILAAQGAAKRPEIAKEMGINVDDPQAVKSEISRLQGEVERWKNWAVHPDLVAQVFGHDPKDNPLLQDQPDLPPEGRTVPEPLRSQEEVEGDLEKTFTDRGNDQTPSMFGFDDPAPAPEPEPEAKPDLKGVDEIPGVGEKIKPEDLNKGPAWSEIGLDQNAQAQDSPAPPPAVDLFGNPVKRNFAGPEMMTDLFGGKVAVDAQKAKPQETIADQAEKGLDWLDQKQQAKTDGTGEMFGSLFSPGNMPAPPPKLDEQGDTVADTLGLSKTDGPAFKGDPEQAKEMAIRALKDHKGWMSKADLDAIVGGDARRALEDSGELKVRMDTDGNHFVALKGAKGKDGLMDADTLDGFQAVGLGAHKLAPENEAALADANKGVETVQAKAAKKFANPDYKAPKGFKVPKTQKEHDERVNKSVEEYGKHIDNLKKVLAAQATMPTRGINGKFFLPNPEGGPDLDFGMNEGMAKKRAADFLRSRAEIAKARAAKAHAEVRNLDDFRNAHEGDPYQAETPKPQPEDRDALYPGRTDQPDSLEQPKPSQAVEPRPNTWRPSKPVPEFKYNHWHMTEPGTPEHEEETKLHQFAQDNYEDLREKYLRRGDLAMTRQPDGTYKKYDGTGPVDHIKLNVDEWRDFLPGYTGTNSNVNHTAASYLNQRLQHEMLHELKGKGNGKSIILAGGGGSGKTSSVGQYANLENYPVVLDQVSGHYHGDWGSKKQMADLAAMGFDTDMVFVDRDPLAAWNEGVVARTAKLNKAYQDWVDGGKQGPEPDKPRTVPIGVAMNSNLGARKATIEAIKDGKAVQVINNNHGFLKAKLLLDPKEQLEYLEGQNHDLEDLKRRGSDETRRLYQSGALSADHAKGLIGQSAIDGGQVQPGERPGNVGAGLQAEPGGNQAPGGDAAQGKGLAGPGGPATPAPAAGPSAPPVIQPEAPGKRAKRPSLTKASRQQIEDEVGRLSTILAGMSKKDPNYNKTRLQLHFTRKKLANLPASGAGVSATSAPPASAPLAADPAPAPAPAPAPQVEPEAPAAQAQAQEDDLDHIDWEETKAMGLPNKVNGWSKGEVKVFNKYKDHPEIQAILKKQKAHQDAWNSGKKPTRSDFSSYDLDQKLEDLDALDRSEGQHPGEMHPWNFMVRQPEYQEFRKAERSHQHGKANKLRLAMRDRHLGHLAKMLEDGREGEISQENQNEFARELRQIKAQIEDKRGPVADDAEHQEQVRNLFSDLKGKLELDQQNGREEGHPDEWEHQEKAALEHLRGAKHKKAMLDHLRRSFVHVYDKMREKLSDDPTQYGDIGGEILRHDRDIAQARADAAKPAGKAKKTSPQDEESATAAAFERDVIAHNNKPAPEPEPFDPFRDSINQHGHPAAKLKAALGHMGDNPNQAGELAQRLKAEFPEAYQEGIDNKLQIPVSLRKHFQGTPTPAPAGPSAPPPVEDVSSLPVATQMSKLADRLKIIANGYNGKGASLKARAHKEYQKVSGQLQELMDNHPDEVDSHQLRQVMHNLTGRTIKGQDQDEILRTVNNQHDGSGKFQPLNAAWQRKQLETEINRLQTGLGVKLSDQEDPMTVASKLRQIDKLKRTIRALDDAAQASGYDHTGGWKGYTTKEQQGAEERRNAYLKKRDIGEHHVTPLEKIASEVQGDTSGLMAALQKHSQELQGKYDDANFVWGTLLHDPLENPAVIDAIEKLPNKEDRYNANMGLNKSYNAIRRAVERGEDIPDEVLNYWGIPGAKTQPQAQPQEDEAPTQARPQAKKPAPTPAPAPAPAPQGDRANPDLDAFFADEPKPQAPAQASKPDRETPDLDAVFDAPAEGPSAPPTPWTRGENPDLDKVMGGTEPAPQAKPQAAQGEDLFGAGMAPATPKPAAPQVQPQAGDMFGAGLPAAETKPKPKGPAKLRKPNRDEEYFMENRLPWSGRGEVDATKYFRSHSPDGEMEADAFVAHGNKHLEQFTSPAGRGRNGPPKEAHKPLEKYNLAQRAQHHLDEFLKEYEIPRETFEKTLAGGGDRNDKANLDHLIRSVKARILAEQNSNGNHLVIHNTDPVRKILGVDPREIISGSDSDLVPNRSRRARIVLNGPETEKGLIAGTHDEQFATGKNRYLFERPLDQREKGPGPDDTKPENGGVWDVGEKRWIPFPEGPNAYKSEGGWSARQYRQNSKDLIGKDDLVDDIKKAVINRSISKKEALSRLAAVDRNVFHNYLGLQRMEHRSISDSLRAFINGQKDYEVKGEAPAQAPAPDLNKPAQAESATPAPNDADWGAQNNGHAAYMDQLSRVSAGLEKGDAKALDSTAKALDNAKGFLDPEGGYGNTWGRAYPDKFKALSDLVSKVEQQKASFQEKPQPFLEKGDLAPHIRHKFSQLSLTKPEEMKRFLAEVQEVRGDQGIKDLAMDNGISLAARPGKKGMDMASSIELANRIFAKHFPPDKAQGPSAPPAIPQDAPAPAAQPAAWNPDQAPGVSQSDIKDAHRAFAYNSHHPKEQGERATQQYVNTLNRHWKDLAKHADTPEKQAELSQEFAKFRDGYRDRFQAYLGRLGQTASSYVAGPSNFNVGQNQKRNAAADSALAELNDYENKAAGAIRRKLSPEDQPIRQSDQDAGQRLETRKSDLEKRQDMMTAVNSKMRQVIGQKNFRAGIITPQQQKELIPFLKEQGLSAAEAAEVLSRDFAGRLGFKDYQLRNNLAQIKRQAVRQEEVQQLQTGKTADAEYDGGIRVNEDPEAGRIRIYFPGKPDSRTISELKSRGWKWAPSQGAWSRMLTTNARSAVSNLMSALGKNRKAQESRRASVGNLVEWLTRGA